MKTVWVPLIFICDEIHKNVKSETVKTLQRLLCQRNESSKLGVAVKSTISASPFGVGIRMGYETGEFTFKRMKAYQLWSKYVSYGGDWDHKEIIKSKYGGEFTVDAEKEYVFRYDIWSNIHYGFVGLYAGFSKFELSNGAGVAQFFNNKKSGTEWSQQYFKNRIVDIGDADILGALDDAVDAQAIKVGYSLYEKYGRAPQTLKPADILQELYFFLQNHKPLAIQKCKIRR